MSEFNNIKYWTALGYTFFSISLCPDLGWSGVQDGLYGTAKRER